jgi:RNA-binding protein NOB1
LSRTTLDEGSADPIQAKVVHEAEDSASGTPEDEEGTAPQDLEPSEVEASREGSDEPSPDLPSDADPQTSAHPPAAPLFDDPSDEDDGEGEWITPSNVSIHKSRALNLLPSDNGKGKGKAEEPIHTGCMTADFAMQNVLLQMGLSLVSVDGKRIEKVKSWVLRCHACFKCV